MSDKLQRVYEELRKLTQTEFERVALLGVGGLTGQTLRRSASGRQPSCDGAVGTITVEAKHYARGAPPPTSLCGGLSGAKVANPGLTHWVLVTTAILSQQTVQAIENTGRLCNVLFVPLDWPLQTCPPLAAALFTARKEIAIPFPALGIALSDLADHVQLNHVLEELIQRFAEQPHWAPIHVPYYRYQQGRSQSALLDARYQIVPLMNREMEVAEWCEWGLGGSSWARILTGDGGMGKTRLMIEVCQMLRRSGIHAGFLREKSIFKEGGHLVAQLSGLRPGFVVIDYAEQRTGELEALCRLLQEIGAADRTRLVLLARSAGDWLVRMRNDDGAAADVLSGVDPRRLLPVAPIKRAQRLHNRATVMSRAIMAMAAADGRDDGAQINERLLSQLDLDADRYDRILLLLAEAWRGIFAPRSSVGSAWEQVIRRERMYLKKKTSELGGDVIMTALSWICLHSGAETRDEAEELLLRCSALRGSNRDTVRHLAELLHRTYPGQQWLNPIQPDLLASALMDAYPT